MNQLNKFWGKCARQGSDRHPLLGHLLDVAAVMESLLQSTWVEQHIAKMVCAPLSAAWCQRLCVLACLHDVGKLAPGFQLRRLGNKYPCNHLESLSYSGFSRLLCGTFERFFHYAAKDLDTVGLWLDGCFSHHGTTFIREPNSKIRACWQPDAGLEPECALAEMATELELRFPLAFRKAEQDADLLQNIPVLSHFFVGLLMLADWIASDRDLFPFCGESGRPGPSEDPLPFARIVARQALQTIGLDVASVRPLSIPAFTAQFPHIHTPRPLQSAVDDLPLAESGSLVFMEGETGTGKTEAALRHFTRLFTAGLVDGLYFANPLRFAAEQLHGRVTDFAAHTFAGRLSTVLAIPGYTRMDAIEGHHLPDFRVIWDDISMHNRGWAAEHPKRFLCAPLGVGTIDQALMATLRVPHAHLRATVLQRSLLVVDEVHASDTYMTGVTCALLDLYRRTGGHVLLMSATLGSDARSHYLAAWEGIAPQRANTLIPTPEQAVALPYPRLEHVDATTSVTSIAPQRGSFCKSVQMHFEPYMTEPDCVARLTLEYPQACILIVRNTVRQARLTLAALRKLVPETRLFCINNRPAPHHSRYAAEDRQALDAEVIRCFGKQATRPYTILVATQTLEQSLDVDFDVLITDLCPVDVLLQRIGRLHRHDRQDRGVPAAVCHVLTQPISADSTASPEDWLLSRTAKQYGFGADRAYENLLSVAQTWRMVQKAPLWNLPDDNRRLVETATHPELLRKLAEELGSAWLTVEIRNHGAQAARQSVARDNCLHWGKPFTAECNRISRETAAAISTRLGLADALVRFAQPVRSPLGHDISQLRIPTWMCSAGSSEEDSPITPETIENFLRFVYDSRVFVYTETGLFSEQEWEETCTIF